MSGGEERAASSRALPAGVTWEQVAELFAAALEHPPEARAAYLAGACAGSATLLAEVESLLRSHGAAGEFLAPPATPSPGLDSPLTPSLHAAIDEAPLWTQFAPGAVVGNRYRIRSLLGRGGAGEVYEAWDEELSIPVALKILRFCAAFRDEALKRIKQEALLARTVVHPNICRVYDLGCHGDPPAESVWFLTMEVLRGETLADRLRARGRLTPAEAMPLVEQMAAGLEAAHQCGIVHLDFKSGNVMLAGEPGREQAVIADFGLARVMPSRTADPPAPDDRPAGMAIAGTPAYMAPEQVRGEVAGPAADIYALGVVLYEMVTGALPFTGESPLDVAERRLAADAPSPQEIAPDLDTRWADVIRRCLEREPRRRFARAADVALALSGRLPAQDETAAGSPPTTHSLPAERDRFVGRELELSALARAILGGARIVTLRGTGGMGKTRLALRYGRRSLALWPGGVWFSDLTAATDENGIAAAVGKSLGIRLSARDPAEQLGQAIRRRGRCLVILDNADAIVGPVAASVERWSERAPEAAFLTTSRERLGLGAEAVVDLGPLGMEAGSALFIERAKRLRPGLELDVADLAAASEVVRLVEGIPLAIELAAARVRVMTMAQIVAAMRRRFSLLTGGPSERHEALATVIDDSWELLKPWEKAALAQCSVFEGGFTLEAAESVLDLAACSGLPQPVAVVQSLVDKSLLRTWMSGQGGGEPQPNVRLGMFVSLQEYARGKLAEEGAIPGGCSGATSVRAAEERHGRWYGRYGTDAALTALDAHGAVERRLALGAESENLLAAARRAAARGDGEVATAAYRAAAAANAAQGPFARIVELGGMILGGALSPQERASVLLALARAERSSGRMQDALAHYTEALALYRAEGDRPGEGLALGNMGNVYLDQGRMDEACSHFEAALEIDREVGNRHSEGVLRHALGTAYHNQGRLAEARTHLQAALAIHRETGSRRSEATAINSLAALDCDQGRLEEGRLQFEAALAIYREMDDRDGEGIARRMLGVWHRVRGSLAEASKHTEDALAIYRAMGNRRWEATVLNDLANLRFIESRLDEAREHAASALEIAREVGNRRVQGTALHTLGHVHFRQGRTAEAREALIAAEALLRAARADGDLLELLCTRARLEHESGNAALARALLGQVEALGDRIGAGPDSEFGRRVAALRATLS
jgi:predicted ATPase